MLSPRLPLDNRTPRTPIAAAIEFAEALPVSARRDEIAAAMREHQVVIVSGSCRRSRLRSVAAAPTAAAGSATRSRGGSPRRASPSASPTS
jgi:ATP-dependent helicase HrpA